MLYSAVGRRGMKTASWVDGWLGPESGTPITMNFRSKGDDLALKSAKNTHPPRINVIASKNPPVREFQIPAVYLFPVWRY